MWEGGCFETSHTQPFLSWAEAGGLCLVVFLCGAGDPGLAQLGSSSVECIPSYGPLYLSIRYYYCLYFIDIVSDALETITSFSLSEGLAVRSQW